MKWTKRPLAEVADFCLGKMLDDKKNKGDPLLYLANINVRWGEFELDDLREMRFEQDERDRYGLKYGDIVMCEGGEPGRCAIWKDQIPGMMIQKALHRIRPRNGLDNRFLFYSFLHKGKVGAFSPLFTGSTIKHLPRQQLAKIEIDFPELDVQRRIADILSAYDDLIENNRRRMALLEEAARQLYREWFVRLRFQVMSIPESPMMYRKDGHEDTLQISLILDLGVLQVVRIRSSLQVIFPGSRLKSCKMPLSSIQMKRLLVTHLNDQQPNYFHVGQSWSPCMEQPLAK